MTLKKIVTYIVPCIVIAIWALLDEGAKINKRYLDSTSCANASCIDQ